jgi:hypothetical protein
MGRESFPGGIYIALLSAFSLEGGLDGLPLRVASQSPYFISRVGWSILDCARRTIYVLPPSLLVLSLGMGAD